MKTMNVPGVRDRWLVAVFTLAFAAAPAISAATPSPHALQGWDSAVEQAKAKMSTRLASDCPFLWSDEMPGVTARIKQGEIVVAPADGAKGMHPVDGGLIHRWVGAVFIPKATAKQVLDVVRDYGRYKDIYLPAIVGSADRGRSGNDDRYFLRMAQHVGVINATVDGEYESQYFPGSGGRWYSVTLSTSMREVVNRGLPNERELPPDQGHGYIWRAGSIARIAERDGGVYLEIEPMLLTTGVPAFWRWLVVPVVERLSRDSVTASLEETRKAVLGRAAHP